MNETNILNEKTLKLINKVIATNTILIGVTMTMGIIPIISQGSISPILSILFLIIAIINPIYLIISKRFENQERTKYYKLVLCILLYIFGSICYLDNSIFVYCTRPWDCNAS